MAQTTKGKALATLEQLGKALKEGDGAATRKRALELVERLGPEVQAAVLSAAVRECRGNLVHACKAHDIPHRTARRWIAGNELLEGEVERARG